MTPIIIKDVAIIFLLLIVSLKNKCPIKTDITNGIVSVKTETIFIFTNLITKILINKTIKNKQYPNNT